MGAIQRGCDVFIGEIEIEVCFFAFPCCLLVCVFGEHSSHMEALVLVVVLCGSGGYLWPRTSALVSLRLASSWHMWSFGNLFPPQSVHSLAQNGSTASCRAASQKDSGYEGTPEMLRVGFIFSLTSGRLAQTLSDSELPPGRVSFAHQIRWQMWAPRPPQACFGPALPDSVSHVP